MEYKSKGYTGWIIGATILAVSSQIILFSSIQRQKQELNITPGFAVPSKLEVELQDIDNDQKYETVMKYDGKTYLLKIDEQGRPKIEYDEVRRENE